ncbi:MAG: hypothetical protein ACFB51_21080, partial [Anaerolineae bacterium]
MTSFLIVVAAMAFFGIVHSLTAGMQLRRRLHPIFGERVVAGWYRLAYNILSGITLLPALAAVAILPADVIYAVPLPWALLMRGLQLIGLLGLAVAATAFDLFCIFVIAQALAFLECIYLPLLSVPLNTGVVYLIVLHPLYF